MKLTKKHRKFLKLRKLRKSKNIRNKNKSKTLRNKGKALRNKRNKSKKGGKRFPEKMSRVYHSDEDEDTYQQDEYDDENDENIQPQSNIFSDTDKITRVIVYDNPVVRLDYVPPAEYTREGQTDFYNKKGMYNTFISSAKNARINNIYNYSLRDIERTEARAKNLRNAIYNLYGRDIEDEWNDMMDVN